MPWTIAYVNQGILWKLSHQEGGVQSAELQNEMQLATCPGVRGPDGETAALQQAEHCAALRFCGQVPGPQFAAP